jgi:hypothetical protein
MTVTPVPIGGTQTTTGDTAQVRRCAAPTTVT